MQTTEEVEGTEIILGGWNGSRNKRCSKMLQTRFFVDLKFVTESML